MVATKVFITISLPIYRWIINYMFTKINFFYKETLHLSPSDDKPNKHKLNYYQYCWNISKKISQFTLSHLILEKVQLRELIESFCWNAIL